MQLFLVLCIKYTVLDGYLLDLYRPVFSTTVLLKLNYEA